MSTFPLSSLLLFILSIFVPGKLYAACLQIALLISTNLNYIEKDPLSPIMQHIKCLFSHCRYRASTHYRPDLQPTERAHKLTIFLHHVANLIYNVVQDQYTDPRILAFWMANSSEFLHFLKSDRHISAFSVQAQEVLAESVQTAFRNLVNCFRVELSQTLNQFLSENIDHDSAAGLVLTVLGSAMALLRRCRVNAALTIQFFSQLFHYINVICFNTVRSQLKYSLILKFPKKTHPCFLNKITLCNFDE